LSQLSIPLPNLYLSHLWTASSRTDSNTSPNQFLRTSNSMVITRKKMAIMNLQFLHKDRLASKGFMIMTKVWIISRQAQYLLQETFRTKYISLTIIIGILIWKYKYLKLFHREKLISWFFELLSSRWTLKLIQKLTKNNKILSKLRSRCFKW